MTPHARKALCSGQSNFYPCLRQSGNKARLLSLLALVALARAVSLSPTQTTTKTPTSLPSSPCAAAATAVLDLASYGLAATGVLALEYGITPGAAGASCSGQTMSSGPGLAVLVSLGALGGVLTVSTCSPLTTFDTTLFIGTGCPTSPETFACAASNDDAGPVACANGVQSVASVVVSPGVAPQVWVIVQGYGAATGNALVSVAFVAGASPSTSHSWSSSVAHTPSRSPTLLSPTASSSASTSLSARATGATSLPLRCPTQTMAPTPFVSLGDRILSYLHSRGEALTLTSPSPARAVYIDTRDLDYNNPGTTIVAAAAGGANIVLLAFFLSTGGTADAAQVWGTLSPVAQANAVAQAHAQGAVVMVSVGGAYDSPYAQQSGSAVGTSVASWALANHLDGVDFDMENFAMGLAYAPLTANMTIAWLVAASIAARNTLCADHFVTHAPQAPYFGTIGAAGLNPWTLASGGYSAVWAATGPDVIDAFLVQYYNQGVGCYTTYTGLILTSGSDCAEFPGTSLAEIVTYGVPAARIVVGKPMLPVDGSNGYVAPTTLGVWFAGAPVIPGGISTWQWSAATGPGFLAVAAPPLPSLSTSASTSPAPASASRSRTPPPSVSSTQTPPPTPPNSPTPSPVSLMFAVTLTGAAPALTVASESVVVALRSDATCLLASANVHATLLFAPVTIATINGGIGPSAAAISDLEIFSAPEPLPTSCTLADGPSVTPSRTHSTTAAVGCNVSFVTSFGSMEAANAAASLINALGGGDGAAGATLQAIFFRSASAYATSGSVAPPSFSVRSSALVDGIATSSIGTQLAASSSADAVGTPPVVYIIAGIILSSFVIAFVAYARRRAAARKAANSSAATATTSDETANSAAPSQASNTAPGNWSTNGSSAVDITDDLALDVTGALPAPSIAKAGAAATARAEHKSRYYRRQNVKHTIDPLSAITIPVMEPRRPRGVRNVAAPTKIEMPRGIHDRHNQVSRGSLPSIDHGVYGRIHAEPHRRNTVGDESGQLQLAAAQGVWGARSATRLSSVVQSPLSRRPPGVLDPAYRTPRTFRPIASSARSETPADTEMVIV